MAVVAEGAEAVVVPLKEITGLRFVSEPRYLRFFQVRFEPIA